MENTTRAGRFFRESLLFIIGGMGYNLIELCWRGYSHWSMTLLGGMCFHMIGRIFIKFSGKSRVGCCVISALAVTAAEFATGCLVNRVLKMQVWDYSGMPFNLLGQICVLYSMLWGFLSFPAAYLYSYIRRRVYQIHRHGKV